MMKKEKPMMSVTAIIQGAQAQHWGRSLAALGGHPNLPLGTPTQAFFKTCTYIYFIISYIYML